MTNSGSRVPVVLAFGLLFVLQVVCIQEQRTPWFEDDAAFFFRYAENLAAGHGYRWNIEEPPVWGASAPLWPLLLAAGVKLGLSAAEASLLWSWILVLCATGLLGLVVHRVAGVLGVLALAPLLAINHLYSTWATSGMESPLTFLLVVSVLAVAAGSARGPLIGVVAGLCIVHKLDLAPLGVVLLGAVALWRRDQLRSALLPALALAVAWYGFAAWYFGFPLPNSFLRKLTADYASVGHTWYVRHALLLGAGVLRLPLATLGLWVLRERRILAVVALAAIAIPSLAYTLRPPQEGFMWYTAAVSPAVAFLTACGLARLLEVLVRTKLPALRAASVGGTLALLSWFLVAQEYPRVRGWHEYLTWIEPPLVHAGEWVDRNTPPDARVLTSWGNAAYSSRRFVYDWSFLNRPSEKGSLLEKYTPEVWIQLHWRPLAEFRVPKGYRVVRMFRPPPEARSANSVLVLLRADVPVPATADGQDAELTSEVDPAQFRPPQAEAEVRRADLRRRFLGGEDLNASEVDEELLRVLERLVEAGRKTASGLPAEQREQASSRVEAMAARVAELRKKKAGS